MRSLASLGKLGNPQNMAKARLTFETTPARKVALENSLGEAGVSLPEWFEGTVAEATGNLFGQWMNEATRDEELSPCLHLPEAILKGLRSIDWEFAREDTRYLSHDIHPYPAKFIPQIPHYLIQHLSSRGETVLDPFGGSGTTALEATLLDRCGLSSDANPLAKVIGEAKTTTMRREDDEVLSQIIERFSLLARHGKSLEEELVRHRESYTTCIPRESTLAQWFAPYAIEEMAYGVWCIAKLGSKAARTVALASFSKSVLKASFQDGETRYARKPRDVARGETLKLLAANIALNQKKVRQLGPLLRFRQPVFKTIDLRDEGASGEDGPHSWDADCADLIITSPPYPNATDYHLYHRFRLLWLGFDPRALGRQEIGSHLRHQRQKSGFDTYCEEMTLSLRAMYRALRPGRYAVLVLGDGIFAGETVRTSQALANAAHTVGFDVVGEIDRALPENKRSFVAPARRLKQEQILVLRRPPAAQRLFLLPPPYRLWPYETILREREIAALTGHQPQYEDKVEDARSGQTLLISRDGYDLRPLSRLTFTHGVRHPASTHVEPTWQATLENGDAKTPSARKDPKYVTHGIHAYKGKFYPQLAKSLFNLAQLAPGQRVLDPFCGSGTVVLEAYLNGLHGYGLDIHPLAVHIAGAKSGVLEADPYWCDRILSDSERVLERLISEEAELSNHTQEVLWRSTFASAAHDELVSWFPLPVLDKLARIWRHIESVAEPRVRSLLEVLLSSLVREVSHQDPRDLRIRRRAEPLDDAPVYALFSARLREVRGRLRAFASASPHAPAQFQPTTVKRGDGRALSSFEALGLGKHSVDAVVTSPPYATALPYIDTDRLSLLLLFALRSKERASVEEALIGSREITPKRRATIDSLIDAEDWEGLPSATARSVVSNIRRNNDGAARDGEPVGFRRQNTAALLYLYFRDMARVMSNLDHVLKPGGHAFFCHWG
ncbi:MAG: restriction endonuclease [Candidatus Competibacteraceae bacterium]|nr:restriction endonuclease [Candidatus Competibacteraceae bacterium]